jgi:hypothetical protein
MHVLVTIGKPNLLQVFDEFRLCGFLSPEERHLRAQRAEDADVYHGQADTLHHLVHSAHAATLKHKQQIYFHDIFFQVFRCVNISFLNQYLRSILNYFYL